MIFRISCFGLASCLLLAGTEAFARDSSGNEFNPRISFILDSKYADYSRPESGEVGGVLLAEEAELPEAGFSLGETELVFEANVDDQWHAWASVAFHEDDVELEEAYADTLALPAGLALKVGRFKSDLGYQNRIHAHAWDFADAPIIYRALLGGQLGDDGVQLRWIAPTDLYVELGAEALRGAGFPAGGEERDGFNSFVGFLHLGGDLGTGGAWRLGLSQLSADADGRETGEDADGAAFSGDSDVSIVDVVYKWAPDGNATVTNFVLNAEYMHRREKGELVFDPAGTATASAYDGTHQGFYAQAVYQFMPRWRIGARYDRMQADNRLDNPSPGQGSSDGLTDDARVAQRSSLMVDFSNSEFSRVRLQYNRDESGADGKTDNQYLLQFVYSVGAHPAHAF